MKLFVWDFTCYSSEETQIVHTEHTEQGSLMEIGEVFGGKALVFNPMFGNTKERCYNDMIVNERGCASPAPHPSTPSSWQEGSDYLVAMPS